MTADGLAGKLKTGAADFGRFALVGVTNTLVDFGVTNLLVLTFKARTSLSLMAISVAACALATLNSYLLNRKWTFRRTAAARPASEVPQFFAVALLAMLVNTSVFLFVVRYVPDRLAISHLAAVNLGKLAGVAAAFAVSFLGYRFGVFQTQAVGDFRRSFRFSAEGAVSFAVQAAVLAAGAAFVRAGYLLLTTAVFGDAVSYAWVADSLSRGEFSSVDVFWSSLFCYWEALFRILGLGLIQSAIAASIVPGILLVIPVVWMSRALFGPSVAWVAGLLTVAHPRLVEYSCNGYAETFYLLLFTLGTAFLVHVFQTGRLVAAFGWGSCFGLYMCVRSEALVAFELSAVAYALVFHLHRRRNGETHRVPAASQGVRRIALVLLTAHLGFGVSAATYAGLSLATLGNPGLFQKTTNLAKQFSEQLDTRAAARETYGAQGALYGGTAARPSTGEKLSILFKRLPRNVLYSLERIPGVLLSPMILFALILPLFARSWGRSGGDTMPLLLMAAFPLMFYPLIQVEPRLFMSVLVPVHIFGAAGLLAFSNYVGRHLGSASAAAARFYALVSAAVVLASLGLTAWRGADLERGHAFHRELGSWIRSNVGPGDTIVGCGYGYVATTGFVVSRRTVPRVWTDKASELAQFAHQRSAGWIVVYEPFLRAANPELLTVLDEGIPGFERVFEVRDRRGWRSQIYRDRSMPFPRR